MYGICSPSGSGCLRASRPGTLKTSEIIHQNKKMKYFLLLFLTCFTTAVLAQSQQQKIAAILNALEYEKSPEIKSTLHYLEKLEKDSSKDTREKAGLLLKELSDEKITGRISKAFTSVFTEKEISDLYDFFTTATGKKLLPQLKEFSKTAREQFSELIEVAHQIPYTETEKAPEVDPDIPNTLTLPYKTYPKGRVDRPDGFYILTDLPNKDSLQPGANPSLGFETLKAVKEIAGDYSKQPIINMQFNEAGTKALQALTKNNLGKQLAIIVNNRIVSAPYINSEIAEGDMQLTGLPSEAALKEIVDLLKKYISQ